MQYVVFQSVFKETNFPIQSSGRNPSSQFFLYVIAVHNAWVILHQITPVEAADFLVVLDYFIAQ